MKSTGKALSRFDSERPTSVRRQRSTIPPTLTRARARLEPAPEERFVSTAGPDRRPAGPTPGTILAAPFVRFVTSAASLDDARARKRALGDVAGTTVVIYRRSRVQNRFRLCQIDPDPGVRTRSLPAVAFDLFRVPDDLLTSDRRAELAAKVARVLDGFGQQPPPTSVDPS